MKAPLEVTLARLAERATPGKRRSDTFWYASVSMFSGDADAEFIAATDPATIRALCACVTALRQEHAWCNKPGLPHSLDEQLACTTLAALDTLETP
jgi:hypothetical protein